MADPGLTEFAGHLVAAKMFSLASCVMLFYDIVLTFGDEVELIWMKKFTPFTALWFANRYLSPLGYIVIIVSFHDPWPKDICNRYVLYPEALKIVTAFAIGVIFIVRLHGIYARSWTVVVGGSVLLAAELAVKIWAFTSGTSLDLPSGFVGCILVGRDDSLRMSATWIAELVFDSAMFLATLYRTVSITNLQQRSIHYLLKLIRRDGVAYFAVIFVANLVTVLMYFVCLFDPILLLFVLMPTVLTQLAPPDIKVINASFSTLITSLMVSRLILNLRRAGEKASLSVYTGASVTAAPGHLRPKLSTGGTLGGTSTGEGELDSVERALKSPFGIRRAIERATAGRQEGRGMQESWTDMRITRDIEAT
ncbi:hypothetical protein AX16_001477 [Volvariella volvacea WC 439]|nr:hypothetical protein AX16_001477 [Volvariella volvacea WC 439]